MKPLPEDKLSYKICPICMERLYERVIAINDDGVEEVAYLCTLDGLVGFKDGNGYLKKLPFRGDSH